jgi:hypothetical protein
MIIDNGVVIILTAVEDEAAAAIIATIDEARGNPDPREIASVERQQHL